MKNKGSFASTYQADKQTSFFLKGSTIDLNLALFDKTYNDEAISFVARRPTSMQPKSSPYKKEGTRLALDQFTSSKKEAGVGGSSHGSRTSRIMDTKSQVEMIYGGKKKVKVLVPGSYKPPTHPNSHRILSTSGSVTARVRNNYDKPAQMHTERVKNNTNSTLATNVSFKYSLFKPHTSSKHLLMKTLEKMKSILKKFKARREQLLKENKELKLEHEKLKKLLLTNK